MPKFFVLPKNITDNQIIIDGDDAKHIKNVLRMREKESITVCDGNENDYECEILSFGENLVSLRINSKNRCFAEPNVKVTLFQGLPKADKMELIIQKCVELGIDKIVPVETEHTVVKLDKKEQKKLDRWRKISESAAKQSGRGKIPEIGNILSFKEAISKTKEYDLSIIPYEKEEIKTLKFIRDEKECKSVAVFIGPEGGFSNDEVLAAKNCNIIPITLGKRILRTETAGFSTLNIILYELEC